MCLVIILAIESITTGPSAIVMGQFRRRLRLLPCLRSAIIYSCSVSVGVNSRSGNHVRAGNTRLCFKLQCDGQQSLWELSMVLIYTPVPQPALNGSPGRVLSLVLRGRAPHCMVLYGLLGLHGLLTCNTMFQWAASAAMIYLTL